MKEPTLSRATYRRLRALGSLENTVRAHTLVVCGDCCDGVRCARQREGFRSTTARGLEIDDKPYARDLDDIIAGGRSAPKAINKAAVTI